MATLASRRRSRTRLIDLSHPLVDAQAVFPGDPPVEITPHGTIASMQYNITQINMGTHQGTHVDAPFHFFDDGTTIDKVNLTPFFGPAKLVDLAPRRALKAKTPLTVEMFRRHEKAFVRGARVIYRTGWERMFGRAEYFADFPTLTLEAARWIASKRIALLGMDTPTPSADWLECHHILLGPRARIVIVEGLRNLGRLPRSFTFIGFPLRIAGRDGSPIRAVAAVVERG